MGKKKCMQCKEWITDNIIETVIGEKSMHFCSESCREKAEKIYRIKEKNKANKNAVYEIICDIFGYKIENTTLYNEWSKWNHLADNAKIRSYLEDNKQYITQALRQIKDQENRRIMYFSAILRNNLHDYHPKVVETVESVASTDDTFIVHTNNKTVTRKKGFAEEEDDD